MSFFRRIMEALSPSTAAANSGGNAPPPQQQGQQPPASSHPRIAEVQGQSVHMFQHSPVGSAGSSPTGRNGAAPRRPSAFGSIFGSSANVRSSEEPSLACDVHHQQGQQQHSNLQQTTTEMRFVACGLNKAGCLGLGAAETRQANLALAPKSLKFLDDHSQQLEEVLSVMTVVPTSFDASSVGGGHQQSSTASPSHAAHGGLAGHLLPASFLSRHKHSATAQGQQRSATGSPASPASPASLTALGAGAGSGSSQDSHHKLFTPENVQQSSMGLFHSLFLTRDGQVLVSGDNSFGQLGLGSDVKRVPRVIPLGIFDRSYRFKRVVASGMHSFFISSEGTVWVCGNNAFGELGLGHTNRQCTPVLLAQSLFDNLPIEDVICGESHTIFMSKPSDEQPSPRLFFCGDIRDGRCGVPSTSRSAYQLTPTPMPVDPFKHGQIVKVACGAHFTLMLNSDGRVLVCGANLMGELTQSIGKQAHRIEYLDHPIALRSRIVDMSCGLYHSVLLTEEGIPLVCGKLILHEQRGSCNPGGEDGDATMTDAAPAAAAATAAPAAAAEQPIPLTPDDFFQRVELSYLELPMRVKSIAGSGYQHTVLRCAHNTLVFVGSSNSRCQYGNAMPERPTPSMFKPSSIAQLQYRKNWHIKDVCVGAYSNLLVVESRPRQTPTTPQQ